MRYKTQNTGDLVTLFEYCLFSGIKKIYYFSQTDVLEEYSRSNLKGLKLYGKVSI